MTTSDEDRNSQNELEFVQSRSREYNDNVICDDGSIIPQPHDQTRRKLKSRHIQLISISGTIGTGLYIAMGSGLLNGGPGSLLLGFSIWYDDFCYTLLIR